MTTCTNFLTVMSSILVRNSDVINTKLAFYQYLHGNTGSGNSDVTSNYFRNLCSSDSDKFIFIITDSGKFRSDNSEVLRFCYLDPGNSDVTNPLFKWWRHHFLRKSEKTFFRNFLSLSFLSIHQNTIQLSLLLHLP